MSGAVVPSQPLGTAGLLRTNGSRPRSEPSRRFTIATTNEVVVGDPEPSTSARAASRKADPEAESEVIEWMEAVLGRNLNAGAVGLAECLKDGQVLCELCNKIKPDIIRRINNSSMPFKRMENISNFLKACRVLGVPEHDLFETVDLYEEKDMGVVVRCIFALGRTIQTTVPGFKGPTLGKKQSSPSPREFSAEQMLRGRGEVTKMFSSSNVNGVK